MRSIETWLVISTKESGKDMKQVWGALQANSKLGLCYTPCILTLIYGYTPYINLTIIMKQKQTHKQRRFQPLRTNYATFGGGYFGSIWTSVISK